GGGASVGGFVRSIWLDSRTVGLTDRNATKLTARGSPKRRRSDRPTIRLSRVMASSLPLPRAPASPPARRSAPPDAARRDRSARPAAPPLESPGDTGQGPSGSS